MTYRKKLDKAIATMKEHGWHIVDNVCIHPSLETCCPMGALLLAPNVSRLKNLPYMFETMVKVAAKQLGVEPNSIEAFACGFDGQPITDLDFSDPTAWRVYKKPMNKAQRAQARRFFAMGQQYRKALIDRPLDPGF